MKYRLYTNNQAVQRWVSGLSTSREVRKSSSKGRPSRLENRKKKLGSNLSQLRAENRVKPWSLTQSQAKRINEIAFRLLFGDQPLNKLRPFLARQPQFANPDLGTGHPRWRELIRSDDYYFSFFCLAHLARAAFLALALLSSGLSMAARLFPPFEPPIFPNATA